VFATRLVRGMHRVTPGDPWVTPRDDLDLADVSELELSYYSYWGV